MTEWYEEPFSRLPERIGLLASQSDVVDEAGRYAAVDVEAALAEALVLGDLRVVQATPGAEAANVIEVACSIKSVLDVAVTGAREVCIRTLAVTADQGDIAAAGTPVGTLNKAHNPATGENVAHMTTAAGGTFSFAVTNTAAEVTMVQITAEGCRPKVLKLTFT